MTDTGAIPSPPRTFGRQYLSVQAGGDQVEIDVTLSAEHSSGRAHAFTDIDRLTAKLATTAIRGTEPAVHVHREKKHENVTIAPLRPDEQQLLADRFGLSSQQARGAWYLPEKVKLATGYASVGAYRSAQPAFLMNALRDDTVTVSVTDAGTELYLWTVLLPFLTDLMTPIDLRAPTGKPPTADHLATQWAEIEKRFLNLGLDVEPQLNALAPASSWSLLDLSGMVAAREALITAIADQITEVTVARWRIQVISELSAAFYRKAKTGTPLSTAVLTKALQPKLSAMFAGSWEYLLDYLGENLNPAEQITTTLPEPRLYTGAIDRVAEVATTLNLPVDEVAAMLSAYLGTHHNTQSPVRERTTVMTQWWHEFDRLHAAQKPGNKPLWGLVDETIYVVDNPQAPTPYNYERLLSPAVVADVDRLWDGRTLDRWPERTVSEFQPHQLMADAFGPALTMWQEIGLTCWFICEGPYSRAQLSELRYRHRDQWEALAAMGYPVDDRLFADLTAAEQRLGPPQDYRNEQNAHTSGGVTITTTIDDGARRRKGFEILRDIVTGHRRAWASAHLEDYLHTRWDSELRAVSREYNRRHVATGKTITYKQFARFASNAANHWFNGDLGAVYAAVGEVAPTTPQRHDLLDGHPSTFLTAVSIGLQQLDNSDQTSWERGKLAARSLHYLQLHEALGRPPTQREFGANRYRWDIFGKDPERLWEQYSQIIEQVRTSPPTVQVGHITPEPSTTNTDEPTATHTESSSPVSPQSQRSPDRTSSTDSATSTKDSKQSGFRRLLARIRGSGV